jgi:hypothetical protein
MKTLAMRIACASALLLLVAGCAGLTPEVPAPQPENVAPPQPAAAAATPAPPRSPPAGTPAPTATTSTPPAASKAIPPAAKAQAPAPAAKGPVAPPPVTLAPKPAMPPVAAPPAPAAPPALDLNALKEQLKETKAIGVFTKLTLKNQVDDLLQQFRDYYQGKVKLTLAELRRSYDLLMMKVLALLQDADQKLASAIVSSREAIWGLLADPKKFATLEG